MSKKTVTQRKRMDAILDLFGVDDIRHLPEAVLKVVLMQDIAERNKIYRKFLALHENEQGRIDLSKDLFQDIYEAELAERDAKKQDFTPSSISKLAAMLVDSSKCSSIHEPTAGNGSMLIASWYEHILNTPFYKYRPSDFRVECFELSSRSIPLLLLNLSMRGMVGEVVHGDVLELKAEAIYLLINVENDPLAFSEVIMVDKSTDLSQVDNIVEDRCSKYLMWSKNRG